MAERGFSGVRLEDIGAEAGVSGPAMYRHFHGKLDILAAMLVDISARLLEGGTAVVEANRDPGAALAGLIGFHTDFALGEPDLIRVQDRDLSSLSPDASKTVRSLQRRYVELWTDVLLRYAPQLARSEAGFRVQAAFGLLNSSPRLPNIDNARARELLIEMASAALQL